MDGFGISGHTDCPLFAMSTLGSLTSQTQLSGRPTGPARPRSESRSDRKQQVTGDERAGSLGSLRETLSG